MTVSFPTEVADEERRELAPGRGLGLDPVPVRGQLGRGPGSRHRAHRADTGQWHAQPAQPRYQPGLLELGRIVAPVLRHRIDLRRTQQAELVVQAQRLAG